MEYKVARNGQEYGSYTIDDLRRYLASGNIVSTDMAKSESMADWVPVGELLAQVATPLPPLAAPPSGFSTPGFAEPAYWNTPATYRQAQIPPRNYPLFPVSTLKFVVMSVCTLGLYTVYWSWKMWRRISIETGDKEIWAWARALFSEIWNFALFRRVRETAENEAIPVWWNPEALAIAVVLLALLSRLPGDWGLLAFLIFMPSIPVAMTVREINAKVAAEVTEPQNGNFTAWNIVAIILGGGFMLLALIGLLAMSLKTN